MPRIEIKPATKEAIARYHGRALNRSGRAWIGVRDGEILGIAGYYLDQHGYVMYSSMTEELKKDKRFIVKAIRFMKEKAGELKIPIYAKAEFVTSETVMKHAGFVEIAEGLYRWQTR
jgi:hypothetical protein